MTPQVETVNAYCDDALGELDATGIAEQIAHREISQQEAISAAIARATKVNPKLNAVVSEMYDYAVKTANKPRHGLFAGVPSFIKDNENVKGVPTFHGSSAILAKPSKRSSNFVRQFQSLGLIPLAKTTMPEFGLTATTESTTYGATRNPWNLDHSTGGSSGGSAAMVAAGVVPIAHGNDGGGSTRIPAACCGLIGLKPTRSRLHNVENSHLLPVNLVHQGVLTRSVRDTALFYFGAEKHYRNKKLPELGRVTAPSNKRLRIGFFAHGPDDIISDSNVVTAINDAAKICDNLGHHVEEIPFPFDPILGDDFLLYWGMLASMFSTAGGLLTGARFNKKQLEPLTLGLSTFFKKNVLKAPMALKRLRAFKAVYEKQFERYDVMLSPVLGHPPPQIGYLGPNLEFEDAMNRLKHFVPFTAIQNVSGAPAISLPIGFSQQQVPVGVQFFAPYGSDKRLLELAFEIELATPFKRITGTV